MHDHQELPDEAVQRLVTCGLDMILCLLAPGKHYHVPNMRHQVFDRSLPQPLVVIRLRFFLHHSHRHTDAPLLSEIRRRRITRRQRGVGGG